MIVRLIMQSLTLTEIVQVATCSKTYHQLLQLSDSAKYILRSVIMRDLDLPPSYSEIGLEKL